MVAHYNAAHITLHARKSNRAAISLYRDTLGFEVHAMEKAYCQWDSYLSQYAGSNVHHRCRWRRCIWDALPFPTVADGLNDIRRVMVLHTVHSLWRSYMPFQAMTRLAERFDLSRNSRNIRSM